MASSDGEVRAAQELEQILLMALSDDNQSRDYADVRLRGKKTRQTPTVIKESACEGISLCRQERDRKRRRRRERRERERE